MRSRLGVSVAVLMATVATLTMGGPAATASGSSTGLALGDSVVFGFITQAGFEYVNANNFVGFPEHAGPQLHLQVSNASCPGETSGSLLSTSTTDNGCQAFRATAPLHVPYTGSQIDYATSFIRSHPETHLVSILIGANDLFLLQKTCLGDTTCILNGLPALFASVGQNLDATFLALRNAGFHGVLVGVTYYSTNYNDPLTTGIVQALDAVIAAHTKAAGGVVADGFGAFYAASAPAGHEPCHAGLLNVNPAATSTCDVHPSQSGQEVLARAVIDAFESVRS
ncbi:MAG TPA: SGNH/GDSL hydrolase family protein [Candidatus Solibacter sp.]|nr:SGNH/GDSL hydrolase family protein [Candidatus Solibacter sp.]